MADKKDYAQDLRDVMKAVQYGDADEEKDVRRIRRDLRKAAANMPDAQVRYFVDVYYQRQKARIRAYNQLRAATEAGEETLVLEYEATQMRVEEDTVKAMMDAYTKGKPLGEWLRSICGIGPIIAAGLMAHIDITKAATAGAIQRFAGLDPTLEWGKGQKRPYNANLKTLCVYKLGESFVKVQNNEKDVYGKLFAEHKAMEQEKNERGELAETAKEKLEKFKIGKDTDAYKWYSQGKLPPAHIHARARRYAVKIFLSHFFEVAYEIHYGKRPPEPYAIAILQHAHKIDVPNWTHV